MSSISSISGRKGSEKSTAPFRDSFSLRLRLFISLALGSGKSDGCCFLESLLFAVVLQHLVVVSMLADCLSLPLVEVVMKQGGRLVVWLVKLGGSQLMKQGGRLVVWLVKLGVEVLVSGRREG